MTLLPNRSHPLVTSRTGAWLLLAALLLTLVVYWLGLHGSYIFDDYPNIVDNHGVQPQHASVPTLMRAALSSPSSEFKRPLSSLSFALNYLTTGLDPFWMKLTNLVIHLLNGLLVYRLARMLIRRAMLRTEPWPGRSTPAAPVTTSHDTPQTGVVAALIAAGWLLLPINLTAVLYAVQRMESLANLFVLLGLIGYVAGRQKMLQTIAAGDGYLTEPRHSAGGQGFALCALSIIVPSAVGILAKETAVMLPLYALLIEWILFHFLTRSGHRDRRVVALFLLVLILPMALGLAWLVPGILRPETWAIRDFTLRTRLFSEARIVAGYVRWTLLPTPHALSFYHDNFRISTGLLKPWTTLASIGFLAALFTLMLWVRQRQPLVALGIALFLGCHLLTATIIPLELIYEHRNYFASFGLLLAVVPLLATPRSAVLALPRHVLLAGLLLSWTGLTAMTAYAWGNPLRLAVDLAARAPQSPRAQYELGRTYIVYSHYDPNSPFTRLAYAPLERAATLPDAPILAEQALIFMNSRMHRPIKDTWWTSLIAKLKARKPTIQDESSLAALTKCVREHGCELPKARMIDAFIAALSHPDPDARLLATYGDYAWNVLEDHQLGLRMTREAVKVSPDEPAYQITLIRMLVAQGRMLEAELALRQLANMNIGGQLNSTLDELRELPGMK